MRTVRLRVVGDQADTQALMTVLHGIDGLEHVEEVADLMPHMDDADSSSSGLPDDIGRGLHTLEILATDPVLAGRLRRLASATAERLGFDIEFLDEF